MKAAKKAKISLLALLAVLVGFIYFFDLQSYLDLAVLKEKRATLDNMIGENFWLASAAYFAIYVAATALSLPGATLITIGAGALFGVVWGTVMVSFASTIGATLAFLMARFLLRDWIQNKFSKVLKPINDGIAREGGLYLLSLRLVPIFPFFMINVVMGLTPIRSSLFFLISQIGMLPGTIVYVNAGTQLSKIQSVGDIASPTLLASFALLGVFPLVAKKVMQLVRARKTNQRNSRSMD